jgi:hypothetical protein
MKNSSNLKPTRSFQCKSKLLLQNFSQTIIAVKVFSSLFKQVIVILRADN